MKNDLDKRIGDLSREIAAKEMELAILLSVQAMQRVGCMLLRMIYIQPGGELRREKTDVVSEAEKIVRETGRD